MPQTWPRSRAPHTDTGTQLRGPAGGAPSQYPGGWRVWRPTHGRRDVPRWRPSLGLFFSALPPTTANPAVPAFLASKFVPPTIPPTAQRTPRLPHTPSCTRCARALSSRIYTPCTLPTLLSSALLPLIPFYPHQPSALPAGHQHCHALCSLTLQALIVCPGLSGSGGAGEAGVAYKLTPSGRDQAGIKSNTPWCRGSAGNG